MSEQGIIVIWLLEWQRHICYTCEALSKYDNVESGCFDLTICYVRTYTVCMKNITLSIDENTLHMGREYARNHNVSFNVLVRRLIEQTVKKHTSNWIDDTFEYIDKNISSSKGITWKREELYRG